MENTVTEDEKTPLAESTPAAETQAATTDDDLSEETKEKKKKDEDDNAPDSDEGMDSDESSDDKKADKKAGKQAFSLFEGSEECVVCHRTDRTESSEVTDEQKASVLTEYRAEVEQKIIKITEAAAVKVEQAEARADAAEQTSNDAQSMLEFFADETVELAITKGLKEASNRDAYKEELRSLGFRGIKALREAYSAAPSKKDEDRKALAESAQAKFREYSSGRENDNKTQGRVAGFAAPIGPASTR